MRLLLSLSLLALAGAIAGYPASAQTIGQNKSPDDGVMTLKVKSQLVVETVVVKDKQGNPISGLTAQDFTLTEDGVPQEIRFCEHQSLASNPLPIPPTPSSQEDVKLYKRLTRTQLTPENPGTLRYKDRRLLALYFDMSAMRPGEQLRALTAAEKFIRTQMTEVDLVSILRYEGGPSMFFRTSPQTATSSSASCRP